MRREYEGAAKKAKLLFTLGGTSADLSLICDDLTGWPDGDNPFWVCVDRGKSSEEKILCSNRDDNILTVYSVVPLNGRGQDGTAITTHAVNATVEHVFTATDADEANLHVNSTSNVHGVVGDVVGTTDVQTLTNKTMDGEQNDFANIPMEAITNLVTNINDILGDITTLEAADVTLQTNITNLTTAVNDLSTSVTNQFTTVNNHFTTIEAELDTKAPIDSPTFTTIVNLPAGSTVGGSPISGGGGGGGGGGLPAGGTTGQVLAKLSNSDGDAGWIDFTGVAGGGGSFIAVAPYPVGGLIGSGESGCFLTYTDGSGYVWRIHKFHYSGAIDGLDVVGTGVIGQILIVAGGGKGGDAGGAGGTAGGGGAGTVYSGDYAYGHGVHNLRVGLHQGSGTVRDSYFDWSPTIGGGIYCYGGGAGGNGGAGGQAGGSGGGGGSNAGGGAATGGTGGIPTQFHFSAGIASLGAGNGGGGGGANFVSAITGTSVTYGAPGGGGVNNQGSGGPANTGAGGHGGDYFFGPGGPGTDGIIVCRYRIA